MTTERIEELYKNGSITFTEAIELGMKKITNKNNAQTIKPLTKEEYLNDFVEHCIDEIRIESDNSCDITQIIDIDKIVNYMLFTDWKWQGKTITRDEVVKTIKKFVKVAVEDIINQVETKPDDVDTDEEYNARVENGGFIVEAWLEHETREIYVKISFVPEKGETLPFNLDEYEKMLLF